MRNQLRADLLELLEWLKGADWRAEHGAEQWDLNPNKGRLDSYRATASVAAERVRAVLEKLTDVEKEAAGTVGTEDRRQPKNRA